MTFSTDKPIRDLTADLSALYRRPWWRFWQSKASDVDAYNAITQALLGNAEPIARFGVKVPTVTPSWRRFDLIQEQIVKLRAGF